MTFALVLALALVVYSYAGYPLVLAAWTGAREALQGVRFVVGGHDRRRRRPLPVWPRLTVVFAAHDEESCILRKVENCLALDYPSDRLDVLVGCDGCTDRTAELARSLGDARVTVVEGPRAGKAAVLARLVPRAQGELVLLTDANVMIERGAARALARHFVRDPGVGAVVGRLRLYNRVKRDFEESLYWKYETVLKYLEGKMGCVLGANGGLYAVRKLLFPALRPGTITDDFVVPVRLAARGWRIPYEPEAIAFEETTEDVSQEFGRRARIGAGNWQSLTLVPEALDPRTGFLLFAFVSHKLLRWTAPVLLAAALALSLVLAPESGLARALLFAQLAFYALALAGRLRAGGPLRRAASAAWYFVSMNAALAVGLWRFLRGTQRGAWTRTERQAPGVPTA